MNPAQKILEALEKAACGAFGVLSTGETLVVAMILNRHDLLGRYTMLEAIDRLGPDWASAARTVEKSLSGDRIQQIAKSIKGGRH